MKNSVIEYTTVARKNERVLVWDIRESIVSNDHNRTLSLVKSWLKMVNKYESDLRVVAISEYLEKLAFTGKCATVKDTGKTATVDIISTGRVKAWLYTIAEKRFVDVSGKATARETRPDEKATRAKKEKKVTKKEQTILNIMEKFSVDRETAESMIA